MIRLVFLGLFALCLAGKGLAQDRQFTLSAPDALVETGLLEYLLPRFSLKTGIRIEINGPTPEVVFSTHSGIAVFADQNVQWRMEISNSENAKRFADWLRSDIGARTIEAFQPTGTPMFRVSKAVAKADTAVVLDGDVAKGEELSMNLCGRCHVVGERNKMKGLGSTPSFAVLRTFPDWLARFETFYVLRPHAAFTQIEDVTPPFDPERPSPIVPVEMTLEDLDAVLAFVQTVPPADLGAPIQSQ